VIGFEVVVARHVVEELEGDEEAVDEAAGHLGLGEGLGVGLGGGDAGVAGAAGHGRDGEGGQQTDDQEDEQELGERDALGSAVWCRLIHGSLP
jgi:hypothetical protein